MIKISFIGLFALLSFPAIFCSVKSAPDGSQAQLIRNLHHEFEPSPILSDQVKWRAAIFKTIKVGSDSRAKALTVLGEPIWTGTPFDESGNANVEELVRDVFDIKDGFHSRIAVISNRRDGLVIFIEGSLARVPIETVLKKFGSSYQRKTYSTIHCDPEDPNSEVLVESDDRYSSIYYIYPDLGIVIPTSDDAFVNIIQYRSKPMVTEDQSCKGG